MRFIVLALALIVSGCFGSETPIYAAGSAARPFAEGARLVSADGETFYTIRRDGDRHRVIVQSGAEDSIHNHVLFVPIGRGDFIVQSTGSRSTSYAFLLSAPNASWRLVTRANNFEAQLADMPGCERGECTVRSAAHLQRIYQVLFANATPAQRGTYGIGVRPARPEDPPNYGEALAPYIRRLPAELYPPLLSMWPERAHGMPQDFRAMMYYAQCVGALVALHEESGHGAVTIPGGDGVRLTREEFVSFSAGVMLMATVRHPNFTGDRTANLPGIDAFIELGYGLFARGGRYAQYRADFLAVCTRVASKDHEAYRERTPP